MIRKKILTFGLICFAFGCANKSPTNTQETNSPALNSPPLNQANTPTLPPQPQTLFAEGWQNLIINANSAKTDVDAIAHFKTSRNACGRGADGVLELPEWNSVAQHLNSAVSLGPSQNPYCVPIPDTFPYMDNSVEVVLNREKRTLYEVRDGQICSTISDHNVSDALLGDIQKIILFADKQDVDTAECPWARV
jgi:hypothetical protein